MSIFNSYILEDKMRLTIDISLDNEAYQDTLGWQLGENMQDIIERIGLGSRNGTVYDSNGNKTGQWRMTDHEQECGK